jgi:nucleoside-diphosphate-sugar epimerase
MATGHSILITGGAGYLGSILVPELLAAGHRVTVLDNFLYEQNSLVQPCAHPAFDVANGDARSAEILKPLVAEADSVFALAALVAAPRCDKDPVAATTTNRAAVATLPR